MALLDGFGISCPEAGDVERSGGLGGLQFMTATDGTQRVFKIVIPYWPIVIPLTLLSMSLLLRKPRVTI